MASRRMAALAATLAAVALLGIRFGATAAAEPPVQVTGTVLCPGGDFSKCDLSGLSDPRVRGTETLDIRWNMSAGGRGVAWGTDRIANDAGSWEGSWAGVMYNGPVNDVSESLRGTGSYAGLTFYYAAIGPDAALSVKGLIYTGSPPPYEYAVPEGPLMDETQEPIAVAGTVACAISDPGAWTKCTDKTSDPRVAGSESVTLHRTDLGRNAAILWGTKVIAATDGTWEGTWNGVRYPDRTYRTSGFLTGTGAYEGLAYWFTYTGTGDPTFTVKGLIYRGSPVPVLPVTSTAAPPIVPPVDGPPWPPIAGLLAGLAAFVALSRRKKAHDWS